MNPTLAKRLFETGVKARNPSLFTQYDYLKTTEWLSRTKLQEIQLHNAERFLRFCGEHSPFYIKAFRESSFKPGNLSHISDINKLPEQTKSTLMLENASIHTVGLNEKLRLAETSGTSGESLEFYRSEKWDSMNRASLMRSYDWYGVKPWDRNGYLWGFNISASKAKKVALLDALQNRFRLFDYSQSEIKNFSKKLEGANFISGYSSMIYEVAKCVNELELGPIPLKMVKGTSEMILDVYHPESLKAFGRTVTCEYGAAEAGLIAFQCPEGGVHVNVENVILEQSDDGELLVTNLLSYSFPIIRYRLGDIVDFSEATCPCGRSHPLIKNIVGRKGANVQGQRKNYPALTFYYVFKNLAVEKGILLNYKVTQEEKGAVTIYIENTKNNKYEEEICKELAKYFNNDLLCKIHYINRFKSEMKKKQYFETYI